MCGIHDAIKDDDVSGFIIGGEFICGRLTYEGRQQSKQIYAETERDLIAAAKQMKDRILAECGEAARYIFPNAGGWALKIL